MSDMVHVPIPTSKLLDLMGKGLINEKRFAESPTGPFELRCEPCGHSQAEHDDDGCLWLLCRCYLPGERK